MQTALITGASSGIGAAFAQELATRQYNLVLIARSTEKLQQLATELEAEFKIQVQVVVQDLAQPQAAEQVYKAVQQLGWEIDLLVNNAGIGDYGPFAERSLEQQSNIVKVNILALVEMTHWFLPKMQQRGTGGIINVGSISGYQPIPYLATYSSSKAFILHFSEALWAENRAKGVKIMAVCPGPTPTNFFSVAGIDQNVKLMSSQSYEDPAEIVKQALQALADGRASLATGNFRTQLLVKASRLTPREFLVKRLEPQFRPPNA